MLASKLLSALGAGVGLCHAGVLVPPVSGQGVLVLEDFAAVKALRLGFADSTRILTVMLCDVVHWSDLGEDENFYFSVLRNMIYLFPFLSKVYIN